MAKQEVFAAAERLKSAESRTAVALAGAGAGGAGGSGGDPGGSGGKGGTRWLSGWTPRGCVASVATPQTLALRSIRM